MRCDRLKKIYTSYQKDMTDIETQLDDMQKHMDILKIKIDTLQDSFKDISNSDSFTREEKSALKEKISHMMKDLATKENEHNIKRDLFYNKIKKTRADIEYRTDIIDAIASTTDDDEIFHIFEERQTALMKELRFSEDQLSKCHT